MVGLSITPITGISCLHSATEIHSNYCIDRLYYPTYSGMFRLIVGGEKSQGETKLRRTKPTRRVGQLRQIYSDLRIYRSEAISYRLKIHTVMTICYKV